jgi:hypothetical protein
MLCMLYAPTSNFDQKPTGSKEKEEKRQRDRDRGSNLRIFPFWLYSIIAYAYSM